MDTVEKKSHLSLGASTSGVSTVNSGVGVGIGVVIGGADDDDDEALGGGDGGLNHHPDLHHQHLVHHQLLQMRQENGRLLAQLLDLQRSYQDLLRRNLDEQALHFRALAQGMGQAAQLRGMWSPSSASPSGQQQRLDDEDASNNNLDGARRSQPEAAEAPGGVRGSPDEQLVEWLKGLRLNQEAIQKVQ